MSIISLSNRPLRSSLCRCSRWSHNSSALGWGVISTAIIVVKMVVQHHLRWVSLLACEFLDDLPRILVERGVYYGGMALICCPLSVINQSVYYLPSLEVDTVHARGTLIH